MVLTTAALTAGCPYAPPARTSGPAEAAGVQMAIVGQYCDDYDETDYQGFEAVEIRMRIAVTNHSNERIAFDPDRVRLIAPDGVRPSPVGADNASYVAPGETKVAMVRFMNRGSLKCKEEMKLDPADSLVAGAKSMPLRPIAFVAELERR